MILYMPKRPHWEFGRNVIDWYLGGPKEGGWTRTGAVLPESHFRLLDYEYRLLEVDEVLAKNARETARWHIAFLKQPDPLEQTPYFQEYLWPRYGEESSARAKEFLILFERIRAEGVRRAVWVADVAGHGFGFRYFRFDGCHRTCCAKVLGKARVPAFVFKTEALGYASSP